MSKTNKANSSKPPKGSPSKKPVKPIFRTLRSLFIAPVAALKSAPVVVQITAGIIGVAGIGIGVDALIDYLNRCPDFQTYSVEQLEKYISKKHKTACQEEACVLLSARKYEDLIQNGNCDDFQEFVENNWTPGQYKKQFYNKLASLNCDCFEPQPRQNNCRLINSPDEFQCDFYEEYISYLPYEGGCKSIYLDRIKRLECLPVDTVNCRDIYPFLLSVGGLDSTATLPYLDALNEAQCKPVLNCPSTNADSCRCAFYSRHYEVLGPNWLYFQEFKDSFAILTERGVCDPNSSSTDPAACSGIPNNCGAILRYLNTNYQPSLERDQQSFCVYSYMAIYDSLGCKPPFEIPADPCEKLFTRLEKGKDAKERCVAYEGHLDSINNKLVTETIICYDKVAKKYEENCGTSYSCKQKLKRVRNLRYKDEKCDAIEVYLVDLEGKDCECEMLMRVEYKQICQIGPDCIDQLAEIVEKQSRSAKCIACTEYIDLCKKTGECECLDLVECYYSDLKCKNQDPCEKLIDKINAAKSIRRKCMLSEQYLNDCKNTQNGCACVTQVQNILDGLDCGEEEEATCNIFRFNSERISSRVTGPLCFTTKDLSARTWVDATRACQYTRNWRLPCEGELGYYIELYYQSARKAADNLLERPRVGDSYWLGTEANDREAWVYTFKADGRLVIETLNKNEKAYCRCVTENENHTNSSIPKIGSKCMDVQ